MSADLGMAIAGFTTTLTEPLVRGFATPWGLQSLMRDVGWSSELPGNTYATVRAAFKVVDDAKDLVVLIGDIHRVGKPTSAQTSKLIVDAAALVRDLSELNGSATTLNIAPFDDPAFWENFPLDLVDLLIVEALKRDVPIVHALLVVLGIVRYSTVTPPAGASKWRVAYERRSVEWAAFADLFTDPAAHFKAIYGIGGALDEISLLTALERAVTPLGVRARQIPLAASRTARRVSGERARELILPIVEGQLPSGRPVALGLIVTPVPAQPTASSPVDGLLISSLSHGQMSTSIGLAPGISLELAGGFDADGALSAEVSPRGVTVALAPPGRIEAKAMLVGQPEKPWILVGDAGGTHVELAGFVAGVEVSGDPTKPEVVALLGTGRVEPERAFALVVDLKEGDSFLAAILGTEPQRVEAGGLLRWSSVSGLAFEGGGGFEIDRPMRFEIGPVTIDRLTIALRASLGAGVKMWAAIDGRVEIGPIKATVQRIGVEMRLVTGKTGEPGAVGDLSIVFGFKSPEAIGARVEASVVTGGGFLSLDPDAGRYAGALQLKVGPVGVAAVGLLDTRLPGGVPGYSLLVAISATFPSVPVGFGFTLQGLGGIVGIHRGLDTKALSAGLKSGVLEGLLFPADPISQAPQIISGLRAVFPPVVDHFVFGPMVRLGWGPGSIILIDVAIVLSIGGPFKLVVLGRVSVLLPKPEGAVVEIHLEIIGYLDMGEKVVEVQGVLRNSRIAALTIAGGMAFRVTFGENGTFGLSVGGFHPRYTPPAGFPVVDRLTIGFGKADGNPRFSLWMYFAVTSNAVMFGGGIELYASGFGAEISGTAELHALFRFQPFSFEVNFAAHVVVSFGGAPLLTASVEVAFSGPKPWYAFAEIRFNCIFDYTVTAELTVGEADQLPIAPEDPTPRLLAALADPANWRAIAPSPGMAAVRLRALGTTTGPVLDPLGTASVTQGVVPLNRTMTRVGVAPIAGPGRYDLGRVAVGGVDRTYTTLNDRFAPAQLAQYSDDEKLTLPAFELMTAGFAFAGDTARAGSSIDGGDDLVTIVVDAEGPPLVAAAPQGFANAADKRLGTLALRAADAEKAFAPTGSLVALAPEQFVVADIGTATARGTARFESRGGAFEALRRQGIKDARGAGVDVAPAHEVAA